MRCWQAAESKALSVNLATLEYKDRKKRESKAPHRFAADSHGTKKECTAVLTAATERRATGVTGTAVLCRDSTMDWNK